METQQKISIVEDGREFFRLLPCDKELDTYKYRLIDLSELKKILILRNQFFYITDVLNFSNIYVSETVSRVLGYIPSDFLDMEFVYDTIHPDDRDFVFAFSKKTIAFAYNYPEKLLENPFSVVFLLDFRMKNINGEYIRLNRQTSCFRTDNYGNMVYAISLYTDINHIKKNNLISYAWKSDFETNFNINDLIDEFQNQILTPRELEIIRLLSQGFSASQIAARLFISEYTVIAHRRNILRKTGAKNTAELIKYGVEAGLI